jgi:hypothetical protein
MGIVSILLLGVVIGLRVVRHVGRRLLLLLLLLLLPLHHHRRIELLR